MRLVLISESNELPSLFIWVSLSVFFLSLYKANRADKPRRHVEQPLYQNSMPPLKASLSSREPTARENPSSTFKGYSWPQDNRLHRRRTARLTTVSPVSVIRSNLASNGREGKHHRAYASGSAGLSRLFRNEL